MPDRTPSLIGPGGRGGRSGRARRPGRRRGYAGSHPPLIGSVRALDQWAKSSLSAPSPLPLRSPLRSAPLRALAPRSRGPWFDREKIIFLFLVTNQ